MAAHRLLFRCVGAFALAAAAWLLALQLLVVSGYGAGAAAGAAAAGHSLCLAAPDRDGEPGAPGPSEDCSSCLFCQQRGSALFGVLAPVETAAAMAPRGEGAPAFVVIPARPPERRAGRGGRSSRAPPAFG
jgi:hypothetical protein